MNRRTLLTTATMAYALSGSLGRTETAAKTGPKTAMICAGLDVDDDIRRNLEEWHSKEHLEERIALDGFLRGRRLYAEDMKPRYFIMYEIRALSDLLSPAYLERLNNPTPWTAEIAPHFRDNFRASCVLYSGFGTAAGAELLVLRIRAKDPAALLAALDDAQMQAFCGYPGIYRARLAIPDVAASTVKTEEFDVSQHRFDEDCLLLIESGSRSDLEALEREMLGPDHIRAIGGEITFRGLYADQASLSKLDLGL